MRELEGAAEQFRLLTQEQTDEVFKQVALEVNRQRVLLAAMAVTDTDMGLLEDKVGRSSRVKASSMPALVRYSSMIGIDLKSVHAHQEKLKRISLLTERCLFHYCTGAAQDQPRRRRQRLLR